MEVTSRKILVTGVSSGVGRTLARHLVKSGATVIGLARREDRLKELEAELKDASGKFHGKTVDVLKEEDVKGLFSWLGESDNKIDVLINNAGVFNFSTLTDGETQDWKVIVDTLVLGYSIFSREAVRFMKKHEIQDALIINILSVNAKLVLPTGAYMYTASQQALDALGTGLRHEIQQQGLPIRISKICPSLINTEKVQNNPDFSKLPSIEMQDIADTVTWILETPAHLEVSDIILRPVGSTM